MARASALVVTLAGVSASWWWMVRGASRFMRRAPERAERGAAARAEGARNAATFIATLDLPDDEGPPSTFEH